MILLGIPRALRVFEPKTPGARSLVCRELYEKDNLTLGSHLQSKLYFAKWCCDRREVSFFCTEIGSEAASPRTPTGVLRVGEGRLETVVAPPALPPATFRHTSGCWFETLTIISDLREVEPQVAEVRSRDVG